MNLNLLQQGRVTTFYVGVGDGEHFEIFEETTSVLEALCSYHQAINDGSEGRYIDLEFGRWIDDEIDPLESYLF